jgi:hypothetical protein
MEWEIQFYHDVTPSHNFINDLFAFLLSHNVKYNPKESTYFIIPQGIKSISLKREERSTIDLNKIINTYLIYDIKTTNLGIYLEYYGDVDFYFYLHVIPTNNKYFISFDTNEYMIPDEKSFFSFVNLCKDAFEKFNFSYGASRSQWQNAIPPSENEFIMEKPDIVNFYGKRMADKVNRKKLLSTPAKHVEELVNGGILLIACTNPPGCPDEMERIRKHLGYI